VTYAWILVTAVFCSGFNLELFSIYLLSKDHILLSDLQVAVILSLCKFFALSQGRLVHRRVRVRLSGTCTSGPKAEACAVAVGVLAVACQLVAHL